MPSKCIRLNEEMWMSKRETPAQGSGWLGVVTQTARRMTGNASFILHPPFAPSLPPKHPPRLRPKRSKFTARSQVRGPGSTGMAEGPQTRPLQQFRPVRPGACRTCDSKRLTRTDKLLRTPDFLAEVFTPIQREAGYAGSSTRIIGKKDWSLTYRPIMAQKVFPILHD